MISGMKRTLQHKAIEGKILCLVFVFMLMGMSGCAVVGGRYVIDEPFKEAQVNGIKRGETTNQEILEWFGPPVAIAREGTTKKIPPPGLRKHGSEEVRSETFFKLFSKHVITEDHVIYYYYCSEMYWNEFYFLEIEHRSDERLAVNKLWILFNAKTGIVEDYLLETSE